MVRKKKKKVRGEEMASIGVLGAGTWGMALARMLSNSGHDVTVWSALEKEIEDFLKLGSIPTYRGWTFRMLLFLQKV